jgi:hypothetical protein
VDVDDDCDDHWLPCEVLPCEVLPCEEVFEGGESSSPSSCFTKNKKNKTVRLRIHHDGDNGLVTIDCIYKFRYVVIPETVIVLENGIME